MALRFNIIPGDWVSLERALNYLTRWIASQPLSIGSSPVFTGLTLSGLTSARIPYIGAGSVFVDSDNLKFDNTNLILGGGAKFNYGEGLYWKNNAGTYLNLFKIQTGDYVDEFSVGNTYVNTIYLDCGGINPVLRVAAGKIEFQGDRVNSNDEREIYTGLGMTYPTPPLRIRTAGDYIRFDAINGHFDFEPGNQDESELRGQIQARTSSGGNAKRGFCFAWHPDNLIDDGTPAPQLDERCTQWAYYDHLVARHEIAFLRLDGQYHSRGAIHTYNASFPDAEANPTTNYERFFCGRWTSNVAEIGTEYGTGGSNRGLALIVDGTKRIEINTAGKTFLNSNARTVGYHEITGSDPYIEFQDTGTSGINGSIQSVDGRFRWWVNGGERVTVLSDGKVGVGQVSPSSLLDVNGTVTATGILDSGLTASKLVATNGSKTLVSLTTTTVITDIQWAVTTLQYKTTNLITGDVSIWTDVPTP